MEWFQRQNLYKKNMVFAVVLILLFIVLTIVILWDMLVTLDEFFLRQLFFRIVMVMLVLLLVAERFAVTISRPFHRLALETAEKSNRTLGIQVEMPLENEKEQLAFVLHTLTASLADAHTKNRNALAEVGRKNKMRDQLLHKLLTVQEDERKRISRELHDEIGQALTTLMVSMRAIADSVEDEKHKTILLGARDLAADTLQSIRDMAVNLRPPVLDDLGLVPAMNRYITTFMALHHIRVEFQAVGAECAISSYTAMALYRIMQESLTNVIRHAEANLVVISIEINEKHIVLKIMDTGKGFMSNTIYQKRCEQRLGIYGMMERVELLGGTFQIQSEPGQGTTISVVVPNVGGKQWNGKKDQSGFGR